MRKKEVKDHMRVIIDRARAERVIGTLMKLYLAREFPYTLPDAQVPQIPENLPPDGFAGTRDHASYLFALCFYMRGGIKSDRAAKAVSALYLHFPEMFRAEYARLLEPAVLVRRLVENGLGFNAKEISRFWPENFKRLYTSWEGDPRRVFDGVASYEEICFRVRNPKTRRRKTGLHGPTGFLGFQEKMTSMLTYFLLEAGLIEPFLFPLPVDFHVLRLLIAHEIVQVEENNNGNFFKGPVLEAIREFSVSYSAKHNVDPLHLSEVLWCFSRSMCSKHPGNTTRYIGPRRGRSTKLVPKKITWSIRLRATFVRTCGQCPIEATCRYNVAAAPYYVQGSAAIRTEREKLQKQFTLYKPVRIVMPEPPRPWKPKKPTSDKQLKFFKP